MLKQIDWIDNFGNGIDCELKQVRLIDKERGREGHGNEIRGTENRSIGGEGEIDGRGRQRREKYMRRREVSGAAKRKTGNEEGN